MGVGATIKEAFLRKLHLCFIREMDGETKGLLPCWRGSAIILFSSGLGSGFDSVGNFENCTLPVRYLKQVHLKLGTLEKTLSLFYKGDGWETKGLLPCLIGAAIGSCQ